MSYILKFKLLFVSFAISLFLANNAFPGEEKKETPSDESKPVTVIDFESPENVNYRLLNGAEITTDSTLVPGGKSAIMWNGIAAKKEWNEFFHSNLKTVSLKANETYTVSFKYKTIEKSSDKGYLYFFAYSKSGGHKADKAWTRIKADSGTSGEKSVTFTLGDFSDYMLVFGYHAQGKVVIDDIEIFAGDNSEKKK